MRYGILSDIHGNLEALESVRRAYARERIDAYLCAGDIVGYGADPSECLKRIQGLKASCVAGNHDWAVSGKLDPAYFSREAREAVDWTRCQLTGPELDFLNHLGLVYQNDDLVMVHGTLYEPVSFHYLTDADQACRSFQLMERNVCFIGHTHAPVVILQRDGGIYLSREPRILLNSTDKYIVNVGSVGQPRDGNPTAAYCVYDTEMRSVEIHRVSYDVPAAQQKIRQAGLPPLLADRLSVGD